MNLHENFLGIVACEIDVNRAHIWASSALAQQRLKSKVQAQSQLKASENQIELKIEKLKPKAQSSQSS